LELGGDVANLRKHLNSIKSDKPNGYGPKRIESIPHAVSTALNKFMSQMGNIPGQQLLTPHVSVPVPEVKAQMPVQEPEKHKPGHCPKCYSPNIAYLSGCTGPTCYECGFSECS
jgi:hypothetical protein